MPIQSNSPGPLQQCTHQLFEQAVAQAPDSIAVVFEDQRLTYADLNSRANQLARYLRRQGVGPEVVVGICVEPSLEMIIGLLGILKTGGAYLPLDPAGPAERLSFMLSDAGPRLLLTQAHLLDELPPTETETFALDEDWQTAALESQDNLRCSADADNLAYVMYTSGSTGTPKGVSVRHRGIVRLVHEADYSRFTPDEVFLSFAPLSFDASTFEIWGGLLNGARLIVAPPGSRSLAELGALIKRERVTSLWLTAGLFHQMADQEIENLAGLHQLLAGGDVLSAAHVERVASELPDCQIINGYGPTENTTFTCCYPVRAGERFEHSVPIGFPISRTQVYILDKEMRELADGLPGELYIAGDGLARGYLNDASLTAAQFIPNPFTVEGGDRLYRSGDRARRFADGRIEFLGRFDRQVKIRGCRLELGEIETILGQHPAVQDCAVLAREDGPHKRLVAYLVQAGDETARDRDARHIGQWAQLYDQTYERAGVAESTFNIAGWISSYTERPIPAAEMREWVDQTVARILAQQPSRVLEIGCGTGLLLFRIAPHCASYHGTDFSARVVEQLENEIAGSAVLRDRVILSRREAVDFSSLPPDSFDTVIINSVVQYFPSVDYLVRVLAGAVNVTRPGGTVFIGDVRSLDLLKTLHASVQLHKASAALSTEEFGNRVQRALADEDELVIDPLFFHALIGTLSKPCTVQVMPKLGRSGNEMNRFRYDVALRVVPALAATEELRWQDCHSSGLDLERLGNLLKSGATEKIALAGVPNARTVSDSKILDLLARQSPPATVGELRAAVDASANTGFEPADLAALAANHSLAVQFSWANSAADGRYDVVFKKGTGGSSDLFAAVAWPCKPGRPAQATAGKPDWTNFVNQRSLRSSAATLVPELRAFLQKKLPPYMIPSAFVLLDRMPLTANGKVDRRALPAPEESRPVLQTEYVAPRNSIEEELAAMLRELLRLDRVGVYDSFFELGGDSLLATQMCARIRELFEKEISPGTFFEEPTIAGLASLMQTLGSETPPSETLKAARVTKGPLSFGQERLWFMNQLAPHTPVHNIPVAIELTEVPDLTALEDALNEIVARHEALRTRIQTENGQAFQSIAERLEVPLRFIDLSSLRAAEREAQASRLKTQEAQEPFDLERGPLFRAKLLRLSTERHLLLLTMHHIISDGWSVGLLLRELGVLYQARRTGAQSPLPPLAFQYADYASWQRTLLAGPLRARQLAYWTKQLEGAATALHLPTDRPRPQVQTFHGSRLALTLSGALSGALKEFSRRHEVTLYMTLLAVFNVLLSRLSGQDDINVGSPIVNRPQRDAEELIGFFLNTVVLRTKLSRTSSFIEGLESVRNTALAAYANQDLPFEMVVEAVNPKRDLSRSPLFQVFFNFLNFSDDKITLPGLTRGYISPANVWSQPDESWSQFDMTLYARELGDQLQFILVYNSDLFEQTRMDLMLEQISSLLEQVVAKPDEQIGRYSLAGSAARALLPDPSCGIDEPAYEPITKTFFDLAEERGDRLAIRKGTQSWSYKQLAQKSEAIARALSSDGLEKSEVVAVTGLPGFGLIASMIGVLSSGGVLLMIDPALPLERRRLMLQEAQARHLIRVAGAGAEEAETLPARSVMEVSVDGNLIDREERDPASYSLPQLDGDDPAYLFFTSGTSGVPKGVLGCHKGLSHFLAWQRKQFAIDPADRAAQLTGLSFDVVLRDMFLPLTAGASLHLPDDVHLHTSGKILTWVESEQITLLHTVPTLARTWLGDAPAGILSGFLRWAFFAGEPFTDSLVRQWRVAFPNAKLVNLYGPTETTLAKCFYVVPDEVPFGVLPVGEPLPQTQALVLNAADELCGIGEPGEIVIRTPFRSLGYVNAAEESRARFITNPFTNDHSDLLYRTGDRGRYRPDGLLEILGRLDDQTKIRGVRVEPDEVNAVLSRQPGVAASVVVPLKDAHGDNALVAYLVPEAPAATRVSQLRACLEKQLPPAMVPGYFVTLGQMPLTPNGKIDRRALPPPDLSSPPSAREFVAPANETEELVARVWGEVLALNQVSARDNFFELGGHSLRATQVLSRINALFKTDLPLSAIFENPTVAGLAAAVEDRLVEQLEGLSEDEAQRLFG